jgi:hypothetical protein
MKNANADAGSCAFLFSGLPRLSALVAAQALSIDFDAQPMPKHCFHAQEKRQKECRGGVLPDASAALRSLLDGWHVFCPSSFCKMREASCDQNLSSPVGSRHESS